MVQLLSLWAVIWFWRPECGAKNSTKDKFEMKNLIKSFGGAFGCFLVLNALALPALAGRVTAVPEIDAGTASSAIALLLGGGFIAISKLRRK